MSFDFNIALTGIGPHSNTKLSSNMSSIQMALYADNGSGKSFISKSFKKCINDLTKEISEKENKVRIDKRKKLIEKLKDYLAIFFKDKYDFDEKQFSVVFQDRALIENTDYVLSDGEKSILAFCFFLANIHGVVENESDYNRLFLVIDDPVSSMDFNYVYNVAQAIRNIKKEPEIGRIRYLVLTHNMEFMSILVRNKIVSKKFLLSDGTISDFKDDYVMPYTANLLDIYKVSIGGMKPIHTIPNQIRHVLETTYRFEGSCGGFDDYILNNEILGKNGCLYSLIEDHSHGGLRTSKGYTDNIITIPPMFLATLFCLYKLNYGLDLYTQ